MEKKDIILFELGKPLTDKEKFIGDYLNKKMKGHGFDYGMQYLKLVEKIEAKAEKAWERKLTKQK